MVRKGQARNGDGKFVAYYRVSTARQGRSGLGLEAQRHAVQEYVKSKGGVVVAEYTEVESGRRHENRPELLKAVAHTKRLGGCLAIAKLDRLTRDPEFLFHLMNDGLRFVAVDYPDVNEMTVGILAVVARDERQRISTRIKEALAAAKRRGTKLGSHRPGHWSGREAQRLAGGAKGRKVARQVIPELARRAYEDLAPTFKELRSVGLSYAEIAHKLNEAGHTTRRGYKWCAPTVRRAMMYLGIKG